MDDLVEELRHEYETEISDMKLLIDSKISHDKDRNLLI